MRSKGDGRKIDADKWLGVTVENGHATFGEIWANSEGEDVFFELQEMPLDDPDFLPTLLVELVHFCQPDRPFAKTKTAFGEKMGTREFRRLERYLDVVGWGEAMKHLGM